MGFAVWNPSQRHSGITATGIPIGNNPGLTSRCMRLVAQSRFVLDSSLAFLFPPDPLLFSEEGFQQDFETMDETPRARGCFLQPRWRVPLLKFRPSVMYTVRLVCSNVTHRRRLIRRLSWFWTVRRFGRGQPASDFDGRLRPLRRPLPFGLTFERSKGSFQRHSVLVAGSDCLWGPS